MIYNREHSAYEEDEKTDVQLSGMDSHDWFAPNVTDEEIFFAKERYKLHLTTPDEGVRTDILKKFFAKKYGF